MTTAMLNVLHSSAGAGKTHALVKQFILLALEPDRPHAYRRILALTFTNKAAAEMKERVLLYLRMLSEGKWEDARIQDLLNALREHKRIAPEEASALAKAALRHMLHHWSELSITTIDAFVRRLVRPFARDLQLDQDLRMTTDQAWYEQRAVELLLQRAGQDHALTEVLVAACEQLVEDERGWDPAAPFHALVKQLGQEQALEHLERLRDLDHHALLALRDRLRQEVRTTRDAIRSIVGPVLQAIADSGLSEGDLAYGKNGFIGYLRKAAAFDDQLEPIGGNTRKAMVNDKWGATKVDPSAHAIIERLAPRFREVLERIEDCFSDGTMRDHFLRIAILRDLMAMGALQALEAGTTEAKRADGVTFFQDLTRSVAKVVQQEPVPFLYERLGQRYEHFLIDEFQDTSLMQWHALLPLVENALSTGGQVFLVGDAKQAIYRWRNGEVRQFNQLPRIFRRDTLPQGALRERALQNAYAPIPALNENYRSSADLVRFNNALFERLRTHLPENYAEVYKDLAQQAVKQHTGLVRMDPVQKDLQGDDVHTHIAERTLAFIQECREDGYTNADIAILVRSALQGGRIARALNAAGIPVISPDGLKLKGDPAVELIVATLEHQQNGEEEAAARALEAASRLPGLREQVLRSDPLTSPSVVLRDLLTAPCASPPRTLFDQVLDVVRRLGLHPAQDAFLSAFLNAVVAHQREHGHEVHGFLEQWDRSGHTFSIQLPEGVEAVKVMTVHKAKGLQFPVVIVPYPEMSVGRNETRLWVDPGPVAHGLPSALITVRSAKSSPDLPEVAEEIALRALDTLDLLYVAFTRPEDRLYALLPEGSNDPFMKEVLAFWLEQQATAGTAYAFGDRVPARIGRERIGTTGELPVLPLGTGDASPIRYTAPAAWEPYDPDPSRRTGQLTHAVLARIHTPEDLPHAVHRFVAGGQLTSVEGERLMRSLESLLQRADLQAFFGKDLTVMTEAPLITGDGHSQRPDRVVHGPAGWAVLDVKTGSPSVAHHEQVRGYMGSLAAITREEVTGALLYVKEGDLIPVQP
ncbi:MAG: UvrD-helicase domain-containing protein [Flavobacteriales bacterium]|nr:UvrD-helicase domain-containing protein [Flavobacteriales bacterium]